jgi:cytochrome c5
MSNKDEGYSSSSFWQLIIAIPGTILAATILISLLAHFSNNTESAPAAAVQTVTAKSDENIKPVATVEVAKADAGPHADKSGEEVFKAVCTACHTPGLMNAPKFGDKGQWEARIAQGYETLVKHAVEGIRSMPARGGTPDLTAHHLLQPNQQKQRPLQGRLQHQFQQVNQDDSTKAAYIY